MKIRLNLEELKKYKKVIDNDFELFKSFKKNPRFITLEKSWIKNISHGVLPSIKGFIHEDREELRRELLKYLKEKSGKRVKMNKWIVKKGKVIKK